MRIGLPKILRRIIKRTDFWKKHYVFFRELKFFPHLVILALLFTFLAAIFEGFGVGFILTFLQNITNPEAEPIQIGIDWFDAVVLGVNLPADERIYRICVLILLITWVRVSFNYFGQLYSQKTQYHLADRLRKRLFEQFQSVSLEFYTKRKAGDLINGITSEIIQITQAFDVVSILIIQGSTLLVYVISMLVLSWQLSILSVMMYTLLSAGLASWLGQIREASFERTKAKKLYTSIALEFIGGIRTVHAFAAQNFERKRFFRASQQFLDASIKSVSVSALIGPALEGASITLLVIMLVMAYALLIPSGQIQSASLLTFLFVLFRISPLVRQVNSARAKLNSFQGSFSHVKELLTTRDKPYLKNGKVVFAGLKYNICLQSVSFGYSPSESVINDITLTISRGQSVALIGASGAGKSTLVDLIPRFYDPTKGKILIDGLDLRKLEINSFRNKIAIVSQNTFIFNDSVRNNITYGIESTNEEAVLKAAAFANALEFIEDLPEGLDTLLGDRGVRLSGGQRQRIAIARALLRNPEILILDEATSALDSVTERIIQRSIEKLSEGRTVIAIAHRLSTIAHADKVIVLEKGKILEQGTYQELLNKRGNLWRYHQIQYNANEV